MIGIGKFPRKGCRLEDREMDGYAMLYRAYLARRDLPLQARNRCVQVGHFFGQIVVLAFQIGNFGVALGDFVFGLFRRGFGVLLGLDQRGRHVIQFVRQAQRFG